MARLRSLGSLFFGLVAVGPMLVTSCSSDDADGPNRLDGGNDSAPIGTSTGFPSSDGEAPPVDAGQLPACVSQEAEALPGKRPVDIIFAIDNSESMSEEIGEVEKQINDNFASIIEASGTDYHVVMISRHGTHGGNPASNPLQKICVKAPLSGTNCDPVPEKPVDGPKFIHHDVNVDSHDALCQIMRAIDTADVNGSHPTGIKSFLRPSAFKVITVISDDRPNTSCFGRDYDDGDSVPGGELMAVTFENYFLANYPAFGTQSKRNYMFHSIIGLSGYDPIDTSRPYPPNVDIATTKCEPGSEAVATGYQALSRRTSGLRFPTCGLNYTSMFKTMAQAVIDRATIECEYAFPSNPPGGAKIDPSTAVVRYTSGATVKDFGQAPSAAACQPNQFYIDTADNNRIKLCPDTCNLVQGDADAKVTVLFSCFPKDVQ